MLEYVLQIQLGGERITSVFSVVLSGAQIPSTEYESEYEYKKSFITLGPGLQAQPLSYIRGHSIYGEREGGRWLWALLSYAFFYHSLCTVIILTDKQIQIVCMHILSV